jgi:hypothetical protein
MKNKTYFLSSMLAVVLGIVLVTCVIIRTVSPAVIIPDLDIPNMVLLSLAALLLDHYLARGAKRCYICIPVFSAICFGLLPYAAAFTTPVQSLKLGLIGACVFTVTTWLFTSMMDRISSGPKAKAAPIVSALGLWLAVQAFTAVIL